VPGSELAGEVLAVGTDVDGIEAGDRVFGTAFFGAFAERAVLPAGQVTKMPAGADFGAAAAFGVAYRTAYHAVDYTTEDLKTRIRELTEGGAHAVIDPLGGGAAEQALRSVRWGGTFVTLG